MLEIISHTDYDIPAYDVLVDGREFHIFCVQGMWVAHELGDLDNIGGWHPTLGAAIAAVEAFLEAA